MTKRQTIFRLAGERPYTSIRNEFLQHPEIPYDVKGLISELLSRPSDWEVSVNGILSINKTVKEKKLRRMISDAEKAGLMIAFQPRNERGVFEGHGYYVGDGREDLKKAIERTSEELEMMIGDAGVKPASNRLPKIGNRLPDEHEHRLPVSGNRFLRQAAKDTQQKKEETKKRNEQKKEESLSHAAQPTAAADERDAALARFENVKKAAKWNPQTSFSAALAEFIKLPAEDQERAVDEAPRYERDSKGCDHRVSLNRYIRDRMFDRPKPEEPKPKGMPNGVWNEIQEAKAAKEAGPPPDPAIQWRAYIDKRIARGGADGRRILKSQIILCLEGSRGWDRANCPLDWVVENYFPDLEHWKPYDKHYAGAL